jgi:hypothetical protein
VSHCRKCPVLYSLAGLAVLVALTCTTLSPDRGVPARLGWVDGPLTDRLCRAHGWHVVPSADGQPAANPRRFYLCDRPRPWPELVLLNQAGLHLNRWEGVVLVQNLNDAEVRDDFFVDMPDQFPGHARIVGPVYLFGDPGMIRRIEAALRGQSPPAP